MVLQHDKLRSNIQSFFKRGSHILHSKSKKPYAGNFSAIIAISHVGFNLPSKNSQRWKLILFTDN